MITPNLPVPFEVRLSQVCVAVFATCLAGLALWHHARSRENESDADRRTRILDEINKPKLRHWFHGTRSWS